MYRRLVVPVDGSPGSETAVPVALAFAQAFSAEVIVCHVLTIPAGPKSSTAPYDAERYVSDIAAKFLAAGVAAKTQLRRGDPAREIYKAAVDWGADAIVMATRSRRRVAKLVLGSVTDEVVRDCHLPVLLVSARRRKPSKSTSEQSAA